MADEMKKCAHPRCSCTVKDTKYCSQICEDAGAEEPLGCDCPHLGCGGRT